MSFQELAPELIHQIYNSLSTISDVINLSLTCHRFHVLLRNAHKLSMLFAAADREYGPIKDIITLVTYAHGPQLHLKSKPILSYALLRQVISVGMVGKRFEELYPSLRWNLDYMNRRELSSHEMYAVRRAVYRFWLYGDAFHNRLHPRSVRLHRSIIEERSQMLRNWTNQELLELEEVRLLLEELVAAELCPSDGAVRARMGKDTISLQWQRALVPCVVNVRNSPPADLFHAFHGQYHDKELPPSQLRAMRMDGWGDDITQYYVVQSMMKLNPAQIMWLHDHAIYKREVESLVQELGEDWFWNNGQTLSDTWSLVLHGRGLDVESMREGIYEGLHGIAPNSGLAISCQLLS